MSEPLLSCDKAVPDLSKLPACVLSNEELLALADEALYPDSLCWGEEDGKIVGGLWGLAEEVGAAMRAEDAEIWTGEQRGQMGPQGQIIFALRAFYLLGVLRGGEAYRDNLLNNNGEPVFAELPFELEALSAVDFMEDLNEAPPELLDKLLALVGVSELVADSKKGGQ